LQWANDTANSAWKSAARLPSYSRPAIRSARSRQLWIARQRASLGTEAQPRRQVGYKPAYAQEQAAARRRRGRAAPGQVILVSQERKSRALLPARQPGKAALPTAPRLLTWFETIDPRLRRTITFDNGTELAQYLVLVARLSMQAFFRDPHSPWQKGAIGNAIGRLRRFLPRKTNIDILDDKGLHACIAAYNDTPRKCLGFKTPAEVLIAQLLYFKM
jgi:hypothetical protein